MSTWQFLFHELVVLDARDGPRCSPLRELRADEIARVKDELVKRNVEKQYPKRRRFNWFKRRNKP